MPTVTRYDELIATAAAHYDVPFQWVKAVVGAESGFNPRAYRSEPRINDASRGLMQLLLRTARGLGFAGEAEQLFDPGVNIDLGTKLLAQLRTRHGDDFQRVYSAYNSGKADLYLTSAQVGEHVRRAVVWLARVSAELVEAADPRGPAGSKGTLSSAMVAALIAGGLLLFLRR